MWARSCRATSGWLAMSTRIEHLALATSGWRPCLVGRVHTSCQTRFFLSLAVVAKVHTRRCRISRTLSAARPCRPKGVVASDVTEGACGAEPNGRAVPLAPQMGVIQGGLVLKSTRDKRGYRA